MKSQQSNFVLTVPILLEGTVYSMYLLVCRNYNVYMYYLVPNKLVIWNIQMCDSCICKPILA